MLLFLLYTTLISFQKARFKEAAIMKNVYVLVSFQYC